jgi:hypothetical protein
VTQSMTTDHDAEQLSEGGPGGGTAYYVYGVVHGEDRPPRGLSGLDDQPVELVGDGPLRAAVAHVAIDRPPGRRKDLVAHSQVVDALAAAGPVVPVQFGSMVADVAEVQQLLDARADTFLELLESLQGREQLTLRASYREEAVLAEVVAADPEIAALRERTKDLPEEVAYPERVRLGELVARAMERKREEDTDVLLDAVLPYVDAHVLRPGTGVEHVMDVALLVDRSRTSELEEHLEGLAEAVHERIRLRLVGPMAPYDFVGDDPWA